ncbi:MAG TPA: DUF192 domain-containing protein [Bacillota bacterium]|nr:DUF192 domain-containing protein [Bacillota bacterium]
MKDERLVQIFRNNECILTNVRLAESFGARMRGLMFYSEWPGIDGLLLYPCNAVHMFWMRFDLSLIYLDRDGKVLHIVERIRPNQIGPRIKDAYFVLETRPGFPGEYQLQIGDVLGW